MFLLSQNMFFWGGYKMAGTLVLATRDGSGDYCTQATKERR